MARPFLINHPEDVRGRNVTVMGLGTFGGGLGAVRFLVENGAQVLVSDKRPSEDLAGSLKQIADLKGIDFRLGCHDWSHFKTADFVVVNPAIPPSNEFLRRIRAKEIPETSEIALFWQLNASPVIAVTGSNGKSTTASLIHTLLDCAGRRAWLGGNIGRSLLPVVHKIEPDDFVVLELSSFQLESLNVIKAAPEIAVVTSFAPNHLDWHGSLDAYRQAKQAILRWQSPHHWCVLNGLDETATWPGPAKRVLLHDASAEHHAVERDGVFALSIGGEQHNIAVDNELPLRGEHNRSNALASVAAAKLAGISAESLPTGLMSFRPLPHRLEPAGEWEGRRFYNDSIATTPESSIAALRSFKEPIVLLAGGYDKGMNADAFIDEIVHRTRAVALLGQTANSLDSEISSRPGAPIRCTAADFPSAFQWCIEQSQPGDIVLLSPGHASYGWFKSFEDRGEQFRALVQGLPGGSAGTQSSRRVTQAPGSATDDAAEPPR